MNDELDDLLKKSHEADLKNPNFNPRHKFSSMSHSARRLGNTEPSALWTLANKIKNKLHKPTKPKAKRKPRDSNNIFLGLDVNKPIGFILVLVLWVGAVWFMFKVIQSIWLGSSN